MKLVDPSTPVDYSQNKTPPSYKCSTCKATYCKLWREYNTFLHHQKLYCADCAGENQKKDVSKIDADGKMDTEYGSTDQIGNLIPAVPTEENDTFWGYTSVPKEGCIWWERLPSKGIKMKRKKRIKKSNIALLQELELKSAQAEKDLRTESDQLMCSILSSHIVNYHQTLDKAAPKLLLLASAVKQWEEQDDMDKIDEAEINLAEALAELESLKLGK